MIECEPIGMVEYFEDGQADHKVFVVPSGEDGEITREVKERLLDFDARYFEGRSDKNTKVGDFLGMEAALAEIKKAEISS